jgi:hypothetical protein
MSPATVRSRRGRPRKEGKRHPSGQLVRDKVEPNERIVAIRKAMLGGDRVDEQGKPRKVDITKAENALDLALERGWLSEDHHRTAQTIAQLHRAADYPSPRQPVSRAEEATVRSGVDMLQAISSMPQAEVAAIWDAAMSRGGARPDDLAERAERARAKLRLIWSAVTAEERRILHEDCIMRSWPQWVIWLASGKVAPVAWDRRRQVFIRGLDKVADVLKGGAR